jgi:hypothetical protein
MNINDRILMEAIESQTTQDLRDQDRYPDDYCDEQAEPETIPLRPATLRASLKPDELALHQKLLEIAKANSVVPSDSYFG